MATWQPPIPLGAICSREFRNLGSAVALLGWCYDTVRSDGWCDLQLKEVAAALDEPYYTLVKWWAKLQAGPFFTEIVPRGKQGFRVRFADEWIEWRTLAPRGTRAQLPKMATHQDNTPRSELPEMATEHTITDAELLVIDSSVTGELPEMATEQLHIGTHDNHPRMRAAAAAAWPHPRPHASRTEAPSCRRRSRRSSRFAGQKPLGAPSAGARRRHRLARRSPPHVPHRPPRWLIRIRC